MFTVIIHSNFASDYINYETLRNFMRKYTILADNNKKKNLLPDIFQKLKINNIDILNEFNFTNSIPTKPEPNYEVISNESSEPMDNNQNMDQNISSSMLEDLPMESSITTGSNNSMMENIVQSSTPLDTPYNVPVTLEELETSLFINSLPTNTESLTIVDSNIPNSSTNSSIAMNTNDYHLNIDFSFLNNWGDDTLKSNNDNTSLSTGIRFENQYYMEQRIQQLEMQLLREKDQTSTYEKIAFDLIGKNNHLQEQIKILQIENNTLSQILKTAVDEYLLKNSNQLNV